MNGDIVVHTLWLIGALVLAGSALAVRRVSFGFAAKSALGWAAIVLVTVVAVSHRHEVGAIFARVSQTLGIDDQQVAGDTVRIRMASDGHFWARVDLNGVERRMLVDSGATITAVSDATAVAARGNDRDRERHGPGT